MTWFRAQFRAVDTWFFSDGRPFNQDDDGLAEANSVFPPEPHVLASALRNLLAGALGHKGGPWEDGTTKLVGCGLWDIGKLWVNGPRFGQAGTPGGCATKFYVPVPGAYAKRGNSPKMSSMPAPLQGFETERIAEDNLLRTEKDDRRHRTVDDKVLRMDRWSSTARRGGMNETLNRDHLKPVLERRSSGKKALAAPEQRVGVALHQRSKTAIEANLFALSSVRPSLDTRLAVDFRVDDASLAKTVSDKLLLRHTGCSLGGRGRSAIVNVRNTDPPPPVDPGSNRFWVFLASPALIDDRAQVPAPGAPLPGCPGVTVLAATLPRPRRFGGWEHCVRSRNWVWAIPAGASFLCEAEDDAARKAAVAQLEARGLNGVRTPTPEQARRSGFGEVLLGTE